jgi:hypothetical protein
MNDIRSSVYAQKVELLLRLIPIVMEENVFAIHGGTAINLFLCDGRGLVPHFYFACVIHLSLRHTF